MRVVKWTVLQLTKKDLQVVDSGKGTALNAIQFVDNTTEEEFMAAKEIYAALKCCIIPGGIIIYKTKKQ